MAAARFAETKDLPTLGVAETIPSIRHPRSRLSAASLERMRLKLRELALRLSKPWTKRRFAAAPLQANSIACAREGKTGAIVAGLTSLSALGRFSYTLGCKPLLPR